MTKPAPLSDAASDLQLFDSLAKQVRRYDAQYSRDPSRLLDDSGVIRLFKQIESGVGNIAKEGTPFYDWVVSQIPKHDFQTNSRYYPTVQAEAAFTRTGVDDVADRWKDFLTEFYEYESMLNEYLGVLAPERFNYKGFTVLNPDRIMERVALKMLSGVDYITALFKRRGVEKALEKGIKVIEIRTGGPWGGNAHGRYQAKEQKVILITAMVRDGSGRLMKNWVHEVFLHEFGHYIHLNYLHPRAKHEWDAGWAPVEKAKQEIANKVYVTSDDRQRFFRLIERNGWDPQKAGRKVKGLDRAKYLAWLYKTEGNPIISTPNQVRLTSYGRHVFKFFGDPDFRAHRWKEYAEGNDPERATKFMERLDRTYKSNLGLTDWYKGRNHPMLTEDLINEIRSSDTSVDDALTALELPSGYARQNEKEDFAETWVAWMENPSSLSDRAKFRMQRALSLSDMYGKKVMRVAARVALRWLEGSDSNWTIPLLEKLVKVAEPGMPAERALVSLIRQTKNGLMDPYPVAELWEYLEWKGALPEEIEMLKKVRPPRAQKRRGPSFADALRDFERATGKSVMLTNIDLGDDELAPALLLLTKAVSKLSRRAARLWQSEVKKVNLRGNSRGSEDASWEGGWGRMVVALPKVTSVGVLRENLIHELGHALEDKLGLTITAWDDTPYGNPPYVSAYAEVNAAEDFAETFRALETEASRLRSKAPAKYEDMLSRV